MRAFLNQLASNKIAESDMTKAELMTDELISKIEMVDKTSKNLIENTNNNAQKSTLFPNLQHYSIGASDKLQISMYGLNAGSSQTFGERNHNLINPGAGRQSGLSSFLSNPTHFESNYGNRVPQLSFINKG